MEGSLSDIGTGVVSGHWMDCWSCRPELIDGRRSRCQRMLESFDRQWASDELLVSSTSDELGTESRTVRRRAPIVNILIYIFIY